jgi:hypothetical protein
MPPRRRRPTDEAKPARAADPLAEVRVEVFAALGDTSLKAECPLRLAHDVAARLHTELERLVRSMPRLAPHPETVPGGEALWVPDEDDGATRDKRLGFAA